MKRGFGSDNHSGVPPEILEALAECNIGHTPSYGTDPWSDTAKAVFKEHFGESCETYFVFNGTGANVCALRALTQGYQSILCSQDSHLHNDECGAPEVMGRLKLITLPSPKGLLKLEDLKRSLIRRGDQHYSQVAALSLTLPTELGTCYEFDELVQLINWAKSHKLFVHIDGARLPLAARYLAKTFKEFTTDLGVDVVSFGGTKNGLMMGEAVLVLNPDLNQHFKYLRKQSMQLPSKSRFIAAQFVRYFKEDLWKRLADNSILQAQRLFEACSNIEGVELLAPPQANAVFAKIPKAWVKSLRREFFFYVWDEHQCLCRWMTSFDTQSEDVDAFVHLLKNLSAGSQNV